MNPADTGGVDDGAHVNQPVDKMLGQPMRTGRPPEDNNYGLPVRRRRSTTRVRTTTALSARSPHNATGVPPPPRTTRQPGGPQPSRTRCVRSPNVSVVTPDLVHDHHVSDALRAMSTAATLLAALGVLAYVLVVGITTLIALQHPDHHRRAHARHLLNRLLHLRRR